MINYLMPSWKWYFDATTNAIGLRLFSHPWVDVDEDGDAINKGHTKEAKGSTLWKLGYSRKTTTALITMGLSNSRLVERSKTMLQNHVSPDVSPSGLVGSAEFNLTLVNKMESTSTKRDMKRETTYGMGKIRYVEKFTYARIPSMGQK